MKAFNINNFASVRLDNQGAQILNEYNHRYDNANWKFEKDYKLGDIVELQLWELFEIFGKHMGISKESPFYLCEMYFKDNDLHDTESIEAYEDKIWKETR